MRQSLTLPSLCVDICALTCDNSEESKVFLHRKSATTTGCHDRVLRVQACLSLPASCAREVISSLGKMRYRCVPTVRCDR